MTSKTSGTMPLDPPAVGAARRPRVLQVITKLDMGGAEVIALDLVSALHGEVDFAVATVLDIDPSPVGRDMARRLEALGVPILPGARGHFKKGGALQAAWRMAQAVSRFRPDLVHLHTEMPELTWAIAGVLFPRVGRVPVLRTVHNCELWISWGGIGRWVTDRLAGATAVAVSQAAAKADAAIPTRHARERAQVVYNGVRRPEQMDGAQPDAAGVQVLFAGRLIEQKAPDLLPAILAAAHAAIARRDVHVRIAGAGPLEASVREALRGVAPGWTITMSPPIEGLASRLSGYDAVLMPSRYEGFGLMAAETLLAGVALVATRAPGLNEVLPQDYPFSAEVDDTAALGRLLAEVIDAPEAARARVAAFGSSLAQRFAPEVMVAGYRGIYAASRPGQVA
jgi:glycosyltransferase involved in cell wall biosynthesis